MKNLRPFLAVLLIYALIIPLAACGGNTDSGDSGAPPSGSESAPAPSGDASDDAPPAGSGNAETPATGTDYTAASHFGFFDPNRDYSSADPHKFVFVSLAWDNMTQKIANFWGSWAERMNVTFQSVSSDANQETFISNIETYAGQGYDGFLLNAYGVTMDQVADLCAENGLSWWSVSEVPRRNDDGTLMGPFVVTNSKQWGDDLVTAEYEWMSENVEGFNPAETMILVLSLTTISEFEDRSSGCEAAWARLMPEAKFEICDGLAEGGITPEVGYTMCAQRFAANPDVKYWIVAAVMDTFSLGGVRFVEEYKLEDTAIISSCGGEDLVPLLEEGTEGAWRFCLYGALEIRFNAVFNGLWEVVENGIDPHDFWPDGYIQREGDQYRGIDAGWIVMTRDNFQDYLEWVDEVTGLDDYAYSRTTDTVYCYLYGDGGVTA
jgi:ABC-type sugar transport system substrate-binding protein